MGKKSRRNSKTLAKNVKQFMATLPSKHLRSLAQDFLQLIYWTAIGKDAQFMGECLGTRFTRRGGNPARRHFQEGRITQLRYETINAQVDMWDLFYDLLQLSWDDMKQVNLVSTQNFPFKTEQDLFFSVLTDYYNAQFCQCLEQYYKNSPGNNEKAGKILKSAFLQNKSLTPEQQQQFDNLTGKNLENFWFVYAMDFFINLAKLDSVVSEKLRDFKRVCDRLIILSVQDDTIARKRKDPAYAWHDNQLSIITSGSKVINVSAILLTYP
jgi:hypothetical protein